MIGAASALMSPMLDSLVSQECSHPAESNCATMVCAGSQAISPACMTFEPVQTLSTAGRLMMPSRSSFQTCFYENIRARSYMSRAVVVQLSRAIFSDALSSRHTALICNGGMSRR